MRTIRLNAENWKTVLDFYDALLAALGAPDWHGESIDAMIDSMILGGINDVDPPYTVQIRNLGKASKDVVDHIELLDRCIAEACTEFHARKGQDIEIKFELVQ